ncbi:nucleoside-diphosphate sugar epimerase [Solibacillus sp. CAU 1738]|uniref:nucleoside-diphosphate sugar epimerase n=1 Tax=Solibacillus sp. CAU 1738 TaxID=3140363 RepID=UPI0032616AEB
MELQKFEQQVKSKLPLPKSTKLVAEKQFCIPIHTVQVTYHPVSRTPMDILMKMMLIAFGKGTFRDGETLADVLLVEPLFINDLLNKMKKTGLLIQDEVISLTEKGKQQLTNGIFEEELDEDRRELLYSPLHQAYIEGDIEDVLDFDEFPEEIDYALGLTVEFDEQKTLDALQLAVAHHTETDEAETPQTIVTSVKATEELQINDVPCFQYILYDTENDIFDVRVFNTLTIAWDEQLEQLIKDKELMIWRDLYNMK